MTNKGMISECERLRVVIKGLRTELFRLRNRTIYAIERSAYARIIGYTFLNRIKTFDELRLAINEEINKLDEVITKGGN